MTKPLEALIARNGNSITGNYYLAKCENCEEMFTSERMEGGDPLYSGDYSDCSCPKCGANDSEISDYGNDAAEAWNFQQKYIDALIAALEQSQQNHRIHAAKLLSERGVLKQRIAELEASQLTVKRPGTTCIGWVKETIHEHDEKWIEAIRAAGGKVEGEE